jgi:nucleoside 2-deoxyribosyltransferase
MQWITDSDVLVAEVTVPSLGVGYEIGRAVEMHKPVLCLFQEGSEYTLSAMIAGSGLVDTRHYGSLEEADQLFKKFFKR